MADGDLATQRALAAMVLAKHPHNNIWPGPWRHMASYLWVNTGSGNGVPAFNYVYMHIENNYRYMCEHSLVQPSWYLSLLCASDIWSKPGMHNTMIHVITIFLFDMVWYCPIFILCTDMKDAICETVLMLVTVEVAAALMATLQWRHNGRDDVSNHRHLDGSINRLVRCRSKKTSKLRVTGLCEGNSPHKGSITRKIFPFDVIVKCADSSRETVTVAMLHFFVIFIYIYWWRLLYVL